MTPAAAGPLFATGAMRACFSDAVRLQAMLGVKVGDVVTLVVDMPGEGLRKGQVGTVVLEFTEPAPAYETEFADAHGRTVAQLALRPDQISHAPRRQGAARPPGGRGRDKVGA